MATSNVSPDQLAAELRDTCLANGANGAAEVTERLEEFFAHLSAVERGDYLQQLIGRFREQHSPSCTVSELSQESYNKLLTMLLGKEILKKNLPPDKMIEQLAAAVNTVFDSVNTLVGGINATLMGSAAGDETIRVIIRSSMDADEGIGALKKFLDQTGEFFAVALKAYKESAGVKIAEILEELNPERLEEDIGGKMKFGPLHKANLYDCYVEKYKTLQNWQRSGLLLEAFVKEFEKNCQNLYSRMNT